MQSKFWTLRKKSLQSQTVYNVSSSVSVALSIPKKLEKNGKTPEK